MRKLPGGWAFAPIGDVTEDCGQRKPFDDEVFKYIDIASIDRDSKDIASPQLLSGRNAPSRARKIVRAGDVLVSMTRPNLNAVALVPESLGDQIASTGFDVLRAPEIEPRWLFYAVRSSAFVERMSELVQGALYPAIKSKDVKGFEMPFAPLNEQQRIADKLDAVLARVDACRERLDRVPDILKRFRQAVLAAATSGKLTEDWRDEEPSKADAAELAEALHLAHQSVGGHKVGNAAPPTDGVHDLSSDMFPDGWELLTLRDLVLPDRPITYGILKPGPELEAGVPYVRVADFPNERLELRTIRRTSTEVDKQYQRSRLRSGDLLLSIRGSVGRLIVIPDSLEGANITQDSARLSIQSSVNRDWVLWYLRSELAQTRMKGATKGVAVRGINIGDVRALQVPLPSRKEQDEIVRRVKSLFTYADRLEARYTTARAQVERLTPALLAKAFRGELVLQDPNDEPAPVLLDRIRAARAAASAKPKRGRIIRKAKMAKPTIASVKEIIAGMAADQFTFNDLRAHVASDYELLKRIVFELLAEPDPSLRQVFDTEAKALRFVRLKS